MANEGDMIYTERNWKLKFCFKFVWVKSNKSNVIPSMKSAILNKLNSQHGCSLRLTFYGKSASNPEFRYSSEIFHPGIQLFAYWAILYVFLSEAYTNTYTI